VKFPEGVRPARIPPHVWERLHFDINDAKDRLEVFYGDSGEIWGILEAEYITAQPAVNLWPLLNARLVRHYLMVHKPELLVC
jgi:hypothetical protein